MQEHTNEKINIKLYKLNFTQNNMKRAHTFK